MGDGLLQGNGRIDSAAEGWNGYHFIQGPIGRSLHAVLSTESSVSSRDQDVQTGDARGH